MRTTAREPLPAARPDDDIRVALSDRPVTQAAIQLTSPAKLMAGDRMLHRWKSTARFDVSRSGGRWRLGGAAFEGARIDLLPDESPGVWVGKRMYRGRLQLHPVGETSFRVINVLPLEHYLASVVDSELPADFPEEARKAQAIAARTYAVSRREQADDAPFDLFASPGRSQNYLGYIYRDARGRPLAGETDAGRRAVRLTTGLICRQAGTVAPGYYSACCGGRTLHGAEQFPDGGGLPSVPCDGCQGAPRYRWTVKLPRTEFDAAVVRAARARGLSSVAVKTIEFLPPAEGRLGVLKVRTTSGRPLDLTTADLQQALTGRTLASPMFTLILDGANCRLEGRGHGHGVGLCQWGARGLALKGFRCEDILLQYYPGVTISPLKDSSAIAERPPDGAHAH